MFHLSFAINLGLLLRRPLFSVACAIASDFYYGVPELACAITLGLLLRRPRGLPDYLVQAFYADVRYGLQTRPGLSMSPYFSVDLDGASYKKIVAPRFLRW
mgnify:FL=1